MKVIQLSTFSEDSSGPGGVLALTDTGEVFAKLWGKKEWEVYPLPAALNNSDTKLVSPQQAVV
jgi:hypothetical protein